MSHKVIGIDVRSRRLLLVIEFLQKGTTLRVEKGGVGPVLGLWMGVVGVGEDVADGVVDVCLAVVHVSGERLWGVGSGAVGVGGVGVEGGRVHGWQGVLWRERQVMNTFSTKGLLSRYGREPAQIGLARFAEIDQSERQPQFAS